VSDLERFLDLIWEPGDVREVRSPKHDGYNTAAGYFDDPAKLVEAVAGSRLDGRANVYLTINPVAPALLARAANRIDLKAKTTTADKDVLRRRWLFVDVDPVRPAAISATEAEREAALEVARGVSAYLGGLGWPTSIVAMSGNGYALFYPIDLPNDEPSRHLVERVLHHLAARFDTDGAKVDTSVANAARIVGLTGTMKVKGDSTPDRPHRPSQLLRDPVRGAVVTAEQLAALAPDPQPKAGPPTASIVVVGGHVAPGWVKQRLDDAGIAYREGQRNGRTWYRLDECPFHPEDDLRGDCGVGEDPVGKGLGHCFHNRGVGKGWQEFKAALGLGPSIAVNGSRAIATNGPETFTAAQPTVGMVKMSTVVATQVRWLWPRYLPRGKVVMVDGDPGVGKSTMLLDIVARGSRGEAAPDGGSLGEPWVTLYVTGEDDPSDTIRPRLDVAGANTDLVYHVSDLTLPDDATRLREYVGDVRAAFLIIDPIVAHLGEQVRTNSDHNVRRALQPLVDIVREFDACAAAIRHLSKEAGRAAMYRGGGSIGFGGLARGVLAVGPDPEDEDRAILAPVKSSIARLGPSLAYRLVGETDLSPAQVVWEGESRYTAEQVIGDEVEDAEAMTKAEKLGAAMLEVTIAAGGRVLAADGWRRLEADGWDLSSADLKSRARKASGIVAKREGFGGGVWYWHAPAVLSDFPSTPPVNGKNGKNDVLSVFSVLSVPSEVSGGKGAPEFCCDVAAHRDLHFTAGTGVDSRRHCRKCSPLGVAS
jgi:hypothetical protein